MRISDAQVEVYRRILGLTVDSNAEHEMKRCPGPCVGLVTAEAYRELARFEVPASL